MALHGNHTGGRAPDGGDMRPAAQICTLLDAALAKDSPDAWAEFSDKCRDLLSRKHCSAIATVVLSSLPERDQHLIVGAVCKRSGYPVPPFINPRVNAEMWAENASTPELRAYVFAAFHALDAKNRVKFTDYIKSQATESRKKETT